jgi:cytochrome c
VTKRILAISLILAGALLAGLAARGSAQTTAAVPAGDAEAGERVFRRLCTACHIATADGPRRLGPPLFGVVGRHSGSVSGYNYTQANRSAHVEWTPENLFEYLKNPRAFIPGTNMTFIGIRDDQERANVIAYLQTLH